MEYNTVRKHLPLLEYGRHIKRIVDKCVSLTDREQRTKMAGEIVELMIQLNPQLKNFEDYRSKLWDHLYMLSEFKLDVDSPYPMRHREQIIDKVTPLPYPQSTLRHRHYGKLVEHLVDKALQEQDAEKRTAFAQCIGNYMKLTYQNWNKDNTNDEIIKSDLRILSKGELSLSEEDNISALTRNSGGGNFKKGPFKPNNRNNNNNNRNNNFKRKKFNNKGNRPQAPQPGQ
ncbi:MAG: DUF4290 domain-containing protein [Chitinophagales bacterium]